jgi:hypothetical protein
MAKAKVQRGLKAAFIRDGLRRYPDLKPKELADRLEAEARAQGLNITTITGLNISQAKTAAKSAPGAANGAAPARKPGRPPRAAGGKLSIDDIRVVQELARRLGAARLCSLVDLIA